jgi:hypothetical protein
MSFARESFSGDAMRTSGSVLRNAFCNDKLRWGDKRTRHS